MAILNDEGQIDKLLGAMRSHYWPKWTGSAADANSLLRQIGHIDTELVWAAVQTHFDGSDLQRPKLTFIVARARELSMSQPGPDDYFNHDRFVSVQELPGDRPGATARMAWLDWLERSRVRCCRQVHKRAVANCPDDEVLHKLRATDDTYRAQRTRQRLLEADPKREDIPVLLRRLFPAWEPPRGRNRWPKAWEGLIDAELRERHRAWRDGELQQLEQRRYAMQVDLDRARAGASELVGVAVSDDAPF